MALAQFLGIRQSSVSDAQKRGVIPAEWLLKLLRKKGVSPDWVLTGEGSRFLLPTRRGEAPPVVYTVESRPPETCSTQELVDELVRRSLRRPARQNPAEETGADRP